MLLLAALAVQPPPLKNTEMQCPDCGDRPRHIKADAQKWSWHCDRCAKPVNPVFR